MDNYPKDSNENVVIQALLDDRRSTRRWKNIRFFVWLLIAIILLLLIFVPRQSLSGADTKNPYISTVRLSGTILPGTNFSAEKVIPQLNKAFADKNAKGVLLLINSPGGSAVQSSIIHDKIMQLKQKYKKKVVVVGEDSLASGAYLIASAADKIYVNPNTLTGSIGVIYNGFGFSDVIQKIGVTRRAFTAGAHKDRLDPFTPLNPDDVTKITQLLGEVHQNFINDVMQGRGSLLKGDKTELFSGDFWIGQDAVKLGLADQTGNFWDAMQQQFGVTHYKDYSTRPSFLQALVKGVDSQLRVDFESQMDSLQAKL
jgi:protease-4